MKNPDDMSVLLFKILCVIEILDWKCCKTNRFLKLYREKQYKRKELWLIPLVVSAFQLFEDWMAGRESFCTINSAPKRIIYILKLQK